MISFLFTPTCLQEASRYQQNRLLLRNKVAVRNSELKPADEIALWGILVNHDRITQEFLMMVTCGALT